MTTLPDNCGDKPEPDEIVAAAERMIASEVFARSPQLGAFLRFVVEASLQGKSDRIKAYTIGVEVLRRDSNFDPQLDPIVRVEATRLRRAIERYYAGPGVQESIIIDLPRGTYVPTFRCRDEQVSRAAPVLNAARRWAQFLRQPPTLASVSIITAIAVVIVVAALALFDRRGPGTRVAGIGSRDFEASNMPVSVGNGMPTIQIEPFRVIGAPKPDGVLPDHLYAKISDAFARFDTINVSSGAEPQADYRLSGTLEYTDGAANAWFTLTDSTEGKVVWSRTFEKVHRSDQPGVTGDSIVITLTNSLLQSYGVIRSRDRARQLASNAGDPRYRCVLEAADAIRTADRPAHERARDCLERLTAADPSFVVGSIFLSMMYSREFQFEYERPGDQPALDRALRTIRQAIAAHPEDSRAYLALMVIQFNRRDIAAALAAGEKSIALNKYDMLTLGEYGGRLIFAGDVDNGMKKLREAGAYGAVRPAWHHIYLFVGSYIEGDMMAALRHARDVPNDNTGISLVARILAAKIEGNRDECANAISHLAAVAPGWQRDPHAELARIIADAGIVDRLSQDLAAVGLRSEPQRRTDRRLGFAD
jgi:tetratricopeptide (TPR) repeat protein